MPYNTATANYGSFSTSSSAYPTDDVINNAVEFIKDKLYFTWVATPPLQTNQVHYFTVDDTLVYINFYMDFGPNNISHVVRFIEMLGEKFRNPALANKKICVYSSLAADKRANAAFLLCTYMLIALRRTPEEAYQPLVGVSPSFVPYRDAGYGSNTYHLTIYDCLKGLHKALITGLLRMEDYNLEEYEFYEKVENGDFNWLNNKFLALASPHDDPPAYASYQVTQQQDQVHLATRGLLSQVQQATSTIISGYTSFLGTGAVSSKSHHRKSGQKYYSCSRIDEMVRYLKEHNVGTIIRLNNKLYDRKKFVDAGIEHIEMYYPDGSNPPENILKRFLEIVESRPGPIAVHCKAGLGRTGSLIAAYLMKNYRFTASEVIGYLRVMRPGSVVGPQQNYLHSMQSRFWKLTPRVPLPTSITRVLPSTFYACTRFDHTVPANVQISQPDDEQMTSPVSAGAMSVDEMPSRISTREQAMQDDDSEDEEQEFYDASPRGADRESSAIADAKYGLSNYSIPIQPRKAPTSASSGRTVEKTYTTSSSSTLVEWKRSTTGSNGSLASTTSNTPNYASSTYTPANVMRNNYFSSNSTINSGNGVTNTTTSTSSYSSTTRYNLRSSGSRNGTTSALLQDLGKLTTSYDKTAAAAAAAIANDEFDPASFVVTGRTTAPSSAGTARDQSRAR